MTFTMTFNDGDFLEQIENIKRDESFCLIANKEKAFISKEKRPHFLNNQVYKKRSR